jgi:hypothetical protein
MSYIGSTPTTQSFIAGTDAFNGTGSATNFTLSRFVNSVNDVQVVVNNVVQYPPNYSVSGNTLTISPAPSAGTNNVYVRYLSTTLQSIAPSQGIGIQFGIGSLALPSISFIGDPNTGIYSPAADTIAFVEGGVEAMRIDSSANVGIGTSSPTTKLDVNGGILSRAAGGEGGEIAFSNPDNASTGLIVDVSSADNGRIFQTRNNSSLQIGQLLGTGGTVSFLTAGFERARIDSSGNLLVGTTTSRGRFTSEAVGTATGCINTNTTASSGTRYHAVWYESGTERGSVTSAGGGVVYNSVSDYRLKDNITPMTGALARVVALKPVTYTWKNSGAAGEGFIAHELQEVCPLAVTREKDAVDEEGKPKYQGIDTSFLVATLTAAIQEQQAMIDTMKQEIAELKAKVGE